MKSLVTPIKSCCIKRITNANALFRISQYQFGEHLQIEKGPENSEQDSENSEPDNPLIQTLKQTKAFQAVTNSNARYQPHDVELVASRRQNRILYHVDESNPFSQILNAKSAAEIWKELEILKSKSQQITKNTKKKSIMELLESLSSKNDQEDNEGDSNDQIQFKPNNIRIAAAYANAIKRCGLLREFDEGFKMFEEAKQTRVSCSAAVFAAAIRLQMEREFSGESLHKCIEMVDDMKTSYKIRPSPLIYAELIKNSTALSHTRKAWKFVKFVLNDSDQKYLLESNALRHAIINYFAKTQQVEQGLVYFLFVLRFLVICILNIQD